MEVCNSSSSELCFIDFSLALASTSSVLINVVCAWIIMKTTPKTDIKTLLRLHNIRAVILILICLTTACETGSSYLLMTRTNDGVTSYGAESVLFFFMSVTSTTILLRIIEVRRSNSAIRWLYAILLSELALTGLKLWKWIYLQSYLDVISMGFIVQSSSLILLLGIFAVDAVTLYCEGENPSRIASKSYDPTLQSQENITYKNPYSSFMSKATFWWMTSLLWKGFFKPLELNDLGIMDEKDTSRYHYDQFMFIYQSFKNKQVSLWTCYARSCWKMFVVSGIFKLLGDLCGLVGPLSIAYIVEFINVQVSSSPQQATVSGAIDDGAMELNNLYNETGREALAMSLINYPDWSEFIGNGWIMSGIVLIAFLLQGTFSQASTNIINMEGLKIKNALQGLIYRKTLSLSASCFYMTSKAAQHKNNDERAAGSEEDGNDDYDLNNPGTITNLMSDDSLNVMTFFWICHYVWSIPLKIAIVVYCLYLQLGVSSLIGSAVTILTMIPLQFLVGRQMSKNSEEGAKSSDERLKKIREIFFRIKLVKLNAWEDIFIQKIADCRQRELHYLNIDALYWTLMTFLTHISSILITVVTFAAYTLINDGDTSQFKSSNVFAALALFNQLTVPLFIFPITVPIIITSLISTKRIQRFLSQPEIEKEFEGVRHMARIISKSSDSLDEDQKPNSDVDDGGKKQIANKLFSTETIDEEELDEKLLTEIKINDHDVRISVRGADDLAAANAEPITVDCLSEIHEDDDAVILRNKQSKIKSRKHNQLSTSSRLERNRLRSTTAVDKHSIAEGAKTIKASPPFKVPDDVIVCIRDARLSWGGRDDTNILQIDHLSIPKGVLTVIVGKSGSGKSSIVGALLKETQIETGSIEWNKYSTIAYSGQQPWLLNGTIRDNILFGESYRPKRYEKIIETCALKSDIELMPSGDLTLVGERGLNLSGGQKMRISIARAVYSSANVIILDDAFSSLDNEVVGWIFEKCIKQVSTKYKRTIILVTQKTQLVYSADYLIAMENMRVRVSGSIKEIKERDPAIIREWDLAIAQENAKESQLSPAGRSARERWKLFKNISRIGLLQQRVPVEEDNLSSTSSIYSTQFKRASSSFGSRLWSDLPLPIDECNDNDVDFPLPELRRKYSDKEKALRPKSLQPNFSRRAKQPLSRNISSPMRFNDTTRVKETDRSSDTSFASTGSKMSFRKFLRRMSSRGRRPSEQSTMSELHRDKRKSNKTISIRSITETEEVVNNSSEERDEHERVVSYVSRCSEEADDDTSVNLEDESAPNRLKYDEERKYGTIPTRIYLLYLKACGIPTLVVFFTSTFMWQALRVYTDVWLSQWTEINDGSDVSYYFNVYCALSGLCIILALCSTPSAQLAGSHSRKRLHDKLVTAVMSNSLHFFQSTPFGRIINRFSLDMSIIDKKIATTSQRLLQFILLCSCAILINTLINKWFILLTVPILVIYYFVQKFYRESTRELQRIESISSNPVISHFSETILGLTTIRAYNQESRFMEMLFKRMEDNNVAFVILNCSNRWLGIALDYLGAIIVFIAILTALISAYLLPDEASASLVALALQYTLLIPIYLNWVVKLFADMEMYFGACERISYYYTENGYHEQQNSTESYEPLPTSWPQHGNIEFRNISLKHPTQTENFITALNLTIPAGQRIGICGRSGSGKSSLANSLFGVVEIAGGQILIDNIDISTIRLNELRSRLSIIPQEDGILFCSTIRENLDPHGRFSDMELWSCLEAVQLKDLVVLLPEKLDTRFSEGESLLSFGQRQLFCLARAVLKGAICLVLDEATSNLDSETEKQFLKSSNDAFKGKTVITIAHRLYSLLDYDRVVIMENGKIIEDGKPKELKSNPKSTFTSMLNASDLSHQASQQK